VICFYDKRLVNVTVYVSIERGGMKLKEKEMRRALVAMLSCGVLMTGTTVFAAQYNGGDNTVDGANAVAVGNGNTSKGTYASKPVAIGTDNTAINHSVAMGVGNTAQHDDDPATNDDGGYDIAMGMSNSAIGYHAEAIG
jgi:hypothetical protein